MKPMLVVLKTLIVDLSELHNPFSLCREGFFWIL